MPGPFVNTKLLSVGPDRTGVERFWISTFNETSGAVGILADTCGRFRRYDFGPPHASFYSAAVENARTLWLCGDLSRVVRLDLSTGRHQSFPTGSQAMLVHAGMAFDPGTRRLFVAARTDAGPTGFTFDLRQRKAHVVHNLWESLYTYNSFPNGDATWTIVFYYPGRLLRWDPRSMTSRESRVNIANVPLTMLHRLAHHPRWGVYLPTLGWYDPARDRLRRSGPRPNHEMMWFAAGDDRILGAKSHGSEMVIARWCVKTGEVDEVARIADTPFQNVTVSRRNDLVAMSTDGVFRIHDGNDFGLKLVRRAPSESVGNSMCLRLIDRNRILGTTFITQRFWLGNLSTGVSIDCGRAAPGTGQITRTWRIGRRLYMASYHGGELMELDPNQPVSFPVNPRVVASHPLSMRPVASASHGPILWYACSRRYGELGSVLLRYDTQSGQSRWTLDPLGPRQIFSMAYNRDRHELICGSTIHSDQAFARPTATRGMLARIDADTLKVRGRSQTSQLRVDVLGWLKRNELLCADLSDDTIVPSVVNAATLKRIDARLPAVMDHNAPWPMIASGRVGRFVFTVNDQLQLHDLRRRESLVRVLLDSVGDTVWHVDGDALLLRQPDGRVCVFDDLLKPERKTATGNRRS